MENLRLIDPVRDEAAQNEFRTACRLTDYACELIAKDLRAGMTELALLERVNAAKERAARELAPGEDIPLAFVIIESGARTALLHGRATDKVIQTGDFVTLDFGLAYKRAHADMTRTFVIGKADEKQREIYEAVLEATLTCERLIKPGMTGKEADSIARNFIESAGYGKEFIHGLGHGFGLFGERDTFDGVALAQDAADTVLREDMVFTIEPGIYIEGFGGVRIEDTVIMKRDGVEPLFGFTKELIEIEN